VNSNNVTFTRCLIDGTIHGTAAFTTGIQGTGFLMQDCEVNGGGTDGDDGGATLIWLGGDAGSGGVIERCNFHSGENGFQIGVNANVTIRDCYFHNFLRELGGEPSPHTDGLQFGGDASGLTIDHCEFDFPLNATSAINFDNESGATNNHMTVNHCRFRTFNGVGTGTGYRFAIYFPRFSGWSNITVTNNVVEEGRLGGWFDSPENCTTFTGNTDYATGDPLTN
jgi:hypothetical protein